MKRKILFGVLAAVFLLATWAIADQEFSQRVWFRNDVIFSKKTTLGNQQYTWPTTKGTSNQVLTTNGSNVLSWSSLASTATDFALTADADAGDYDIKSVDGLYGVDDDVYIDLGTNGMVSIVSDAGITINGAEFDVSGTTGAIIINDDGNAGSITIEGTVLDINSLDFVGAGTITAAASSSITIDPNSGNAAGEDLIITAHNIQLTATGAITMSPDAAVTTALTITDTDYTNALSVGDNAIVGTTGVIDYTNFDVNADGDVTCVDLTASGAVNVGTWKQDAIVPASAAPQTITIDGAGAGGVNIGSTSTGTITLGDDVTVSDTYDVLIGEGKLTIDDDQNETALVITSDVTDGTSAQITSTVTTGKGLSIIADSLAGGTALYLDATEGAGFTGYYILAYDGTANDFAVKRHGEIEITGAAGDMITITTGNLEMTAGDIDVNDGIIEVNTDEDEASYITRAYAGAGSAAAFTVTDSNSSTTQPAMTVAAGGNATTGALTINQTGTGNAVGIDLNVSGDYAAIDIDAGAARDGDVIDILMTNMVDERALYITGAITAAAGEGTIEIHSTGQVAATGSLLRLDNDTAQAADGSDGYILNIDDDTLVATTPVVYAVLLNSNANGALHVSKGVSLFAEAVTFTAASVHNGGLTIAEDIDINFDAADEEISIVNTAEMDNDLAQVTIDNQDADLTSGDLTANMYLLRLRYTDDGDPDGAFLVCEDNNGDDKFIIDAEGTTTMEGTLTVNGDQIVGDGATEMVGVRHDVVDAGATNPYTVTAAMSGTVFINSQAVEFDLPADPTGLEFTFVVANASNLHIDPDGTDQILHSTCAAGDRILSATVGDTVTLVGVSTGAWYVKSMHPESTDWTDAN